MIQPHLPFTHILLALVVVFAWGCNFIFIKLGLEDVPPLFFCFARFLLASIPAIFFIKPPRIPLKTLILYGCVMFGLQFSLLFMGMQAGMTPGLASLLAQTQVFFSIFFAVFFLGERPSVWQILGALISFTGIVLIGMHVDKTMSLLGFFLIIGAAATWGIGNLITKKISHVNKMGLVVWGSLVASIPLFFLSLLVEGPHLILNKLQHISWLGVIAIAYVVYISTWIGYGVWNWLISQHPVSTVVPFTLLVPIVAIMSSIIVFDEPLHLWKVVAGSLVMLGLITNLAGTKLFGKTIAKNSTNKKVSLCKTVGKK